MGSSRNSGTAVYRPTRSSRSTRTSRRAPNVGHARQPRRGTASTPWPDVSAPIRSVPRTPPTSGRLREARNLDGVRTESGRLMGSVDAATEFRPIAPLATAVDSAQPTLRWSPLPGARGYVATIVDDRLRPVAESPRIGGTEW